MTPILKTEFISREVEAGRRVVDAISLSIAPREVVSITGPSGSGKSSFLRLLNRLDEPTSGTVLLDGIDYRRIPPKDLRHRVGLVMQNPFLFPGTIADNLRFGPSQRGMAVPEIDIRLWLEQVGMAGWEDQDVGRLSGGEAQRISIARTLINDPEILLLDEPTSALDDKSKEHVEQLISGLIRQEKMTCLIVTHDEAQAARMATRTIVIDQGKIVADRRLPNHYA